MGKNREETPKLLEEAIVCVTRELIFEGRRGGEENFLEKRRLESCEGGVD